MPQNITTSAKSLVEAAEREIENLSVEDAIKLYGRDDVVLVDIRDPRELQREKRMLDLNHFQGCSGVAYYCRHGRTFCGFLQQHEITPQLNTYA